MQFIETHAHIYAKEFKEDVGLVIEKAQEKEISKIYMPNIDRTSIDGMMELEEKYKGMCISMMGLHPCSVDKNFEKELYLIEEWLGKRKFAAIGETGIDLYWDKTFLPQQEEAFKIQIELAIKYKIPIVIHSRNSFDESISLIERYQNENLTGIFHCFTGSLEEAERVMSAGFLIGIGGVVTFKNSGLDKVITRVDLNKVVLETDSPYLAPVPHRGKRNEPSYIEIVAEKLARENDVELEEIARITTKNALNLFAV